MSAGFLRRRRVVALRWRLAAWIAPPRPPTPLERVMRQAMDGSVVSALFDHEKPISGGAVVYEAGDRPS